MSFDDVPDPFGDLPSSRNAARFLYEQALRVRRPNDPEAGEIGDRLGRLGEDGLVVARFLLGQDDPVRAMVGATALLRGGTGADADRVVRLVRGTAPKGSSHLILQEIIESDPVRGNVALLCDLLRHDDGQTRRVAARALRTRITANDLDTLAPALEDRTTEVRRIATEVLDGIEGPGATELMLDRLVDRSASVAKIAVENIARVESSTVNFELLRRTFADGAIRRPEALLLVAIAEREDRQVSEILRPQHAPPLFAALNQESTLVRSAAALALAGIGFRSPDTEATAWLDGPVPAELVAVAAGSEFFDGFELLRQPAVRRLRQLSGISHGTDGPAWMRWWRDAQDGFHADRAVIAVVAGDESRLILRVDAGVDAPPFVLAGGDLAASPEWIEAEEARALASRGVRARASVLFLDDQDASDLLALLQEAGVFSAERLPGPRGTFGTSGRSIEVQLGERSKSFRFGLVRSEAWFDRLLVRAGGLRDRLSWQRFPANGLHASSRELFLAEAAWWQSEATAEERAARMTGLVLRHLDGLAPVERDAAIEELTAMAADGRAQLAPADVSALVGLLEDESQFGARAQALTQLVRVAGETRPGAAGELSATGQQTNALLLGTLHDHFGPFALDAIVDVLDDAGRPAILAAAVDSQGLMRVAAAAALGEGDVPQDIDLLVGMLRDDDAEVQIAAIVGLGQRRAERARDRIQELCTADNPQVRGAALRATGQIGGLGAVDSLVRGLTDPDQRHHLPAAEGLASLGTPETAPLLVSLLRGARRPAIQAEARRGLLTLGEEAHDELFSAMRSPDTALRRDAALLLARQMEPRSVPVLAGTLAIDRDDEAVALELAILTCVDYSEEALPAEQYFQWWDEVDRQNSFQWFVSALEQRRLRAPDAEAFEGGGTEEARLFLLTVAREFDGVLGERARRELERLLGEPLGLIPASPGARDVWFTAVRERALPEEGTSEGASAGGDR